MMITMAMRMQTIPILKTMMPTMMVATRPISTIGNGGTRSHSRYGEGITNTNGGGMMKMVTIGCCGIAGGLPGGDEYSECHHYLRCEWLQGIKECYLW